MVCFDIAFGTKMKSNKIKDSREEIDLINNDCDVDQVDQNDETKHEYKLNVSKSAESIR